MTQVRTAGATSVMVTVSELQVIRVCPGVMSLAASKGDERFSLRGSVPSCTHPAAILVCFVKIVLQDDFCGAHCLSIFMLLVAFIRLK